MFCSNCGNQIPNGTSNFCPHCGNQINTNNSGRESLLRGLYLVEKYLTTLTGKMQQYYGLEREYRTSVYTQRQSYQDNLVIENAADKSQYTLFIAGIAMSIASSIMQGVFTGNFSNIQFVFIIIALFAIGKIKKIKSLLYICGGLIVVAFIAMIYSLFSILTNNRIIESSRITYVTIYIVVVLISTLISIFFSSYLLKKYNKQVDKYNAQSHEYNRRVAQKDSEYNAQVKQYNTQIKQQRSQLANEIYNLSNDLLAQTANWYPRDYCTLEAVREFIKIVENFEADNIKDIISIYKEDKHRSAVLNNQQQLINLVNESIMEQQKMNNLLMISNAIQVANLITNQETARNTRNINQHLDEFNRKEKLKNGQYFF